MKKLAFYLLALTVSAAVGFAQTAPAAAPAASPAPVAPTLKFSGYLNTGIDADFNSTDTSTYIYGHDENFGGYGSTFKLVGKYDADTWGYKFRLRARPLDYSGSFTSGWQQPPTVNYVYGWYKPVAGATVFAGKLADGTIGGLDDEADIAFFYLEGAEALYSVNGFSVAAAAGKSNPGITSDGLLTAFAAQYSLPKAFTVEAHLTTGYDAWNAPLAPVAANKVDGYAVTGSLDAVDGLTLTAGYNVYQAATTPYTFFDVTVFYTLDKLTIGGKAYDHISASYFDITPSVAYAVTSELTLGANVEFLTADGSTDGVWAGVTTPVGATAIPAVTATYAIGGATTKAFVGYDVTNKTTKTYLDFVYAF